MGGSAMEAAQSHNLSLLLGGLADTLGLTPPRPGGLLDLLPLLVAALRLCLLSLSVTLSSSLACLFYGLSFRLLRSHSRASTPFLSLLPSLPSSNTLCLCLYSLPSQHSSEQFWGWMMGDRRGTPRPGSGRDQEELQGTTSA